MKDEHPHAKNDDFDELQIVVAGNESEFHNWCHRYRISPQSRKVINASKLRRLARIAGPIRVHYVGSYRNRKDLHEINQTIDRIIQGERREQAQSDR